MRAAALRRLTQRLGRRGLQSSRCEDTSVEAVNAWLAEPPSKPTWTIAGACAAHDVFDLNADVVVAVDEGDEPCEPWVAATRIAVPQPPVALGSAAADALPDELADEALLAMAPERRRVAAGQRADGVEELHGRPELLDHRQRERDEARAGHPGPRGPVVVVDAAHVGRDHARRVGTAAARAVGAVEVSQYADREEQCTACRGAGLG